jgi:hypothetical protein
MITNEPFQSLVIALGSRMDNRRSALPDAPQVQEPTASVRRPRTFGRPLRLRLRPERA